MPRPAGLAKTGGRKKGTSNKVTADVKALAQKYGKDAIDCLVNLLKNAENESTKVSAAKELLDRGFGKSMQPADTTVTHDVSEPLKDLLKDLNQPVFPVASHQPNVIEHDNSERPTESSVH